jgi:cell division septum initiation protein DivIVA
MARGVGGLMKAAAGSVAQIPGAEEIVLAAVRDIFKELKQLRRDNARLTRQVETLQQRLDAGRGRATSTRVSSTRPATKRTATKRTASKRASTRSTTKRSTAPARRAPKRRGGILGDLLG